MGVCCTNIIPHNEKKEIMAQVNKASVSTKPSGKKKKNYNSVKPKFGYSS